MFFMYIDSFESHISFNEVKNTVNPILWRKKREAKRS